MFQDCFEGGSKPFPMCLNGASRPLERWLQGVRLAIKTVCFITYAKTLEKAEALNH